MKKTDFVLRRDGQGRRYYLNVAQYETKNHRGSDVNDYDAPSARIYEIPGDEKCPVSSLEKYLGKLNPNCESFWHRDRSAKVMIQMLFGMTILQLGIILWEML